MHWLLFIHKIIFSSTRFEPQVLVFRRIQLCTCSIWYCHSLWEFLVACRYTAWVRTDCRGKEKDKLSSNTNRQNHFFWSEKSYFINIIITIIYKEPTRCKFGQNCLLTTARTFYMFRTLSASIIRSNINCSNSPWCVSRCK